MAEKWYIKVHLSLLDTRDALWEGAQTFDGDEFKLMFQSLCKALNSLKRLLCPDQAPTP